MPNPKTFNDPTFDANQLPEPPRPRIPKKQPPKPPPIPAYSPTRITEHSSEVLLPANIDTSHPIELFRLAFTDEILDTIAKHTNDYATLHPPPADAKRPRSWHPTSRAELYSFLAIQIYMGVHPETELADYWNTADDLPKHQLISGCMALKRFEQIDRYLHVSDPRGGVQEGIQSVQITSQITLQSTSQSTAQSLTKETAFQKVSPPRSCQNHD